MTESKLPTDYQRYIHLSRYSRWDDEKGRRETWEETVDRICSFWIARIKNSNMKEEDKKELLEIIG